MGIVLGFIPWIVYWILVGNIPFTAAVTIAFGIAVLAQLLQLVRRQPARSLDIGTLIVFAALTLAAYLLPDDVIERWLQPLSNLGLFLITLIGVLVGRPFVYDYAKASVDAATAKSSGFRAITNAMTWMWVAAFGLMTAVSAIPPIVDGAATMLDADNLLSIVCYWIVPYTLLGIAGLISALFPPWFERRSREIDERSAVDAAVVPQPAAPVDRMGEMSVTAPTDSRFDEPFPIVVRNAWAGSPVQVEVSAQDLFGRRWRSQAEFTVPADGVVDLARDAPSPAAHADWTEPDANAPIWSMRFADTDAIPELFVPPTDGWQVAVTARPVGATGEAVSRRTVSRRMGPRDMRTEQVEIDGREARLLFPGGPAPMGGWPAVACFGGSEGGFESQLSNAATLAGRGFAALAASWISEADAAHAVSLVPLERFGAALTWLQQRDDVDGVRLTALATSRGAEGLLAAVTRGAAPLPGRMVLISPSAVSWQALGSSGEVPDTASWTLGNRPVPWVPVNSGMLMRQIVHNAWTVGRDTRNHRPSLLRLRPAYARSLAAFRAAQDRGPGGESASGALLDASAAACPILLVAGGEDEVWPSELMARMVANAREASGAGTGDELVVYPGAGHLIRLGLLPTDAPWTNGIAFGGSREGLAAAQADLTERLVAFLAERAPSPLPG